MNIETKYDRGDIVWMMRRDKPTEMKVEEVNVHKHRYGINIWYELRKIGFWGQKEELIGEDRIFPTKEALIASL